MLVESCCYLLLAELAQGVLQIVPVCLYELSLRWNADRSFAVCEFVVDGKLDQVGNYGICVSPSVGRGASSPPVWLGVVVEFHDQVFSSCSGAADQSESVLKALLVELSERCHVRNGLQLVEEDEVVDGVQSINNVLEPSEYSRR